jgi:putative transposase
LLKDYGLGEDRQSGSVQKKVKLDYSLPGKPTDNAFLESFNGRFRLECIRIRQTHHWYRTVGAGKI